MLRFILLFSTLLIGFACQDSRENDVTPGARVAALPDGQYVGMFSRSSPTARYATSNVTLTLSNGRFSGSSDTPRYPAIGSGSYTQTDKTTTFVDENIWTADFDWTLILSDEFERYVADDGTLVLQKKWAEGSYDTYQLRRK